MPLPSAAHSFSWPSPDLQDRSPSDPESQSGAEWFPLEQIWQASPQQLDQGIPAHILATGWQLLVLGDGFTTRNLQILSGQAIEVHPLSTQEITLAQDPSAPSELSLIQPPLCRRRVWLGTQSQHPPLLYATSWWNCEQLQALIPEQGQPIGANLAQARREIFRQVCGVYLGYSSPLEDLLQQPGPFWGRHYLLWQGQQPITLIYEVFSPLLCRYLGPSMADHAV